jgi:large-conductance mechanosensitive channel
MSAAMSDLELPGTNIPIKDVTRNLRSDFQTWIFANSIIPPASGIAIGLATKQVIEQVLNLVILPIFIWITHLFSLHRVNNYLLKYVSKTVLNSVLTTSGEVAWSIFLWMLTLFLTFVILEYVLNRRIIGLKSEVKEADQKNFIKAKLGAEDGIIPTQEQVRKLNVEQEKEKKMVKDIKKEELQQKNDNKPKDPVTGTLNGTFKPERFENELENFYGLQNE